jgi:hypothetical protein
MNLRFGTCDVKSLYRTGALRSVASEFISCVLQDLAAVQQIRWVEVGSQPANHYLLTYLLTYFLTYSFHGAAYSLKS